MRQGSELGTMRERRYSDPQTASSLRGPVQRVKLERLTGENVRDDGRRGEPGTGSARKGMGPMPGRRHRGV